jgi:hypothetical protein
MKKSEKEIRRLCQVWRSETGQLGTPSDRLNSFAFRSWLEQNHPEALTFQSSIAGVQYDVDLWFEKEFRLAGRR